MAHGILGNAAAELSSDDMARFKGADDVVGEVVAVDGGTYRESLAGEREVTDVAHLDEDAAVGLRILFDDEAHDFDIDELLGDKRRGVVGRVVVVVDMYIADEVVPRSGTSVEVDGEDVVACGECR